MDWRQVSLRGFQLAACGAAYVVWIATQNLLETTRGEIRGFTDHTHEWLGGVNAHLNAHPTLADVVMALSSLEVDIAALSMVVFFLLRRESRPLLALWLILVMRQLCQTTVSLPPPEGMIWRYPGFPSVMVTYGTSTDFFFSGHMALASVLATELSARRAPRWEQALAWSMVGIQALVILSMRFHYVTDVVAGLLAAVVATQIAGALGRRIDERFAPWGVPPPTAPVGARPVARPAARPVPGENT